MPHKREPERTAVPGGHESPSGAFKPQTGLRSKCRVFSAARARRFRRAGAGRGLFSFDTKREPERTAVPGGHESPSGAFKPQTGLRSKCRVFSAARSQRFRRAGPDGLRHPASASCLGRHAHPAGRCPNSSSLYPPLAAVVAVALFSRFSDLKAPQPLRRQLPAGERGASRCRLPLRPFP